ncbi:MAG: hypothetical protein KJZ83_22630, partial [Burkholderiaceae bacterium]|nr:hypothetical protein [Burkholderiaceae bacterium]
LVESAADVLDELGEIVPGTAASLARGSGAGARVSAPGAPAAAGRLPARSAASTSRRAGAGARGRADPVEAALGWDPASAELLARRLPELPGGVAAISARLLELELEGRVERLDDGRYRRSPRSRA